MSMNSRCITCVEFSCVITAEMKQNPMMMMVWVYIREREEEEVLPLYTRALSGVPSVRNLKKYQCYVCVRGQSPRAIHALEYSPFLFENIMPLVLNRVTTRCEYELVEVTHRPVEA